MRIQIENRAKEEDWHCLKESVLQFILRMLVKAMHSCIVRAWKQQSVIVYRYGQFERNLTSIALRIKVTNHIWSQCITSDSEPSDSGMAYHQIRFQLQPSKQVHKYEDDFAESTGYATWRATVAEKTAGSLEAFCSFTLISNTLPPRTSDCSALNETFLWNC